MHPSIGQKFVWLDAWEWQGVAGRKQTWKRDYTISYFSEVHIFDQAQIHPLLFPIFYLAEELICNCYSLPPCPLCRPFPNQQYNRPSLDSCHCGFPTTTQLNPLLNLAFFWHLLRMWYLGPLFQFTRVQRKPVQTLRSKVCGPLFPRRLRFSGVWCHFLTIFKV